MIFLYLFLGILALVFLLLFSNAVIRLEYNGHFISKIYILGIPLNLKKLFGYFSRKDNQKTAEKNSEKTQKQKNDGPKRTAEDLYSFLRAIFRTVGAVARGLKRHFKIQIKELSVTVATDDAAKTAIRYGEITALLSSFFALCEEHARFRANYKKILVISDFESEKMQATFCILLRIRPIHLLTTAASSYLAYTQELLELTAAVQTTQKKKGH